MSEERSEAIHDATPYRLQRAKRDGHFAHSHDLAAAAALFGSLAVLYFFGGDAFRFFGKLLAAQLSGDAWLGASGESAFLPTGFAFSEVAKILIPILALIAAVAAAGQLVQTGLAFRPERIAPDLSRIDPAAGLQRIFSLSSATRLGLGMLKIAIVAAVGGWSLYADRERIFSLYWLEPGPIARALAELVVGTGLKVAAALLGLAAIDYAYKRWKLASDLRMTPQEMREEIKEQEGDPQLAARRRAARRQAVLLRGTAAVETASVILSGSTGAAVAVRYNPERLSAPQVVSKGDGPVAERIRHLALQNNIPIIDRGSLAAKLFDKVEINRPVPEAFYEEIADALAWAYRVKGEPLERPTGWVDSGYSAAGGSRCPNLSRLVAR